VTIQWVFERIYILKVHNLALTNDSCSCYHYHSKQLSALLYSLSNNPHCFPNPFGIGTHKWWDKTTSTETSELLESLQGHGLSYRKIQQYMNKITKVHHSTADRKHFYSKTLERSAIIWWEDNKYLIGKTLQVHNLVLTNKIMLCIGILQFTVDCRLLCIGVTVECCSLLCFHWQQASVLYVWSKNQHEASIFQSMVPFELLRQKRAMYCSTHAINDMNKVHM